MDETVPRHRRRTPREKVAGLIRRNRRDFDEHLSFDDDDDESLVRQVRDHLIAAAAKEVAAELQEDLTVLPVPQRLADMHDDAIGPAFRVERLIPAEGNTLLVAQRKAGKTVTALNLAKSLIDGTPFLGAFAVTPISGQVAFLNYELSDRQFRDWALSLGVPAHRLVVVNARGYSNPLGGTRARTQLAAALADAAVDSLIIDPFSVASLGTDANSPADVRAWLANVEKWAREEIGVADIIVTAHAGWGSDARARGASALEDWPDTILTLRVKHQARSLTALGRDVNLGPLNLRLHPSTRLLSVCEQRGAEDGTGGREGPDNDMSAACLAIIRDKPGLSTTAIGDELRTRGHAFRKGEDNRTLRELVRAGHVRTEKGPQGSRLHYPTAPPPPAPL